LERKNETIFETKQETQQLKSPSLRQPQKQDKQKGQNKLFLQFKSSHQNWFK